MTSTKKVKFGMVGAGAIAQAYAQAFRECQAADLVGVADIRLDAAEAIASASDCKGFASHKDMLDGVKPDAVVVCTPPVTHPEICNWFMENGVHVLCEKPLAIDSKSANDMVDCAQRTGSLFTMASKFRYVNDVMRAKSIVTSGILGEIILFENTFTGYVDMSSRWNSDPTISGGGVLIDNGTHSVDIMRYFLGPLAELQAVAGKRVQDLPVEDTVRIFVRSESGVMGSIDLSWSLNKQLPTYINIYGDQGTVVVGWKESKYRRSSDQDWIVFGNGYNKTQAFSAQLDNFAGAIRGDEVLLIKPEDALASVSVVEAAYDAMWRDAWVPVPGAVPAKRDLVQESA